MAHHEFIVWLTMSYNDWYVYIIRCKDNSLYVGRTTNLKKRIKKHNRGEGALFTKNKLPVRLVFAEKYKTLNEALKREFQIKGWRREKKENLIRFGKPILES